MRNATTLGFFVVRGIGFIEMELGLNGLSQRFVV
jgi:hypothetical protein